MLSIRRVLCSRVLTPSRTNLNFHTSCPVSQNRNSPFSPNQLKRVKTLTYYCAAGAVMICGLSYAAVPMYRLFCQATSMGGTTVVAEDTEKIAGLKKVPDRVITVRFTSDTSAGMAWSFKPQQAYIKVIPGETALAFYTATNPTDKPIIGVSTYNVIPYDAGQYFNKIQCFCFEEQMLNPHEQVDMPVFFYIDPEFNEDVLLAKCDDIVLSYTFFEAKEGFKMPVPAFMKKNH